MPESQLIHIRRPMPDFGFQIAGLLGQRTRLRVKVDENKAAELFHLHLIEADRTGVKILKALRMRRTGQSAIQLVDPSVVGAHDARRLTFAGQKLMSAVFADIVKRAQNTIAPPHYGNGMPGNINRDVRTGRPDFLYVAYPLPGSANDLFEVSIEPFGLRVGICPQRHGARRVCIIPDSDLARISHSFTSLLLRRQSAINRQLSLSFFATK